MNVHVSTAFRWRHRLLAHLNLREQESLEGIIELALVRFPESMKGARPIHRPARKRRIDALGWWREPRIDVLAMADRKGGVRSVALELASRRRTTGEITAAVQRSGPVEGWVRIRGKGWPVQWERVAEDVLRQGAGTRQLIPEDPLGELEYVNGYRRRLLLWMRRFRGVASKYLARYLAWHRWCDRAGRLGLAEAAVRWPARRE